MGKVYLVGAGPGDPGYVTVRGLELIRRCDALVYDRLVPQELLMQTKTDCRKIYAGKQAGCHTKTQEEINAVLLECAGTYREVVRLKGGDPFVFGRGGEEAEVLAEHGIDFEIVPGVTSAVAVLECAGIPVTHRNVSRSFHVIAGHSSRGGPVCDYSALVQMGGTLIFLMGAGHLKEIAGGLLAAGMDPQTDAAVISEGTTPRQRILRGTLADIAPKAREQKMQAPAVIAVGKTAGYCFLDGKKRRRAGITATPHFYRKLAAELEAEGIQPVWLCRMEVCADAEKSGLYRKLAELERYQWVAFTSANGVSVFFEAVRDARIDLRRLAHLKFAALGSGTAEKLAEYGFYADFLPSGYTTETFAEEFSVVVRKKERVLIPRAGGGSAGLTGIFRRHGITYTDLPVYEVKGVLTGKTGAEIEDLDYLVFASASGVRDFFRETDQKNIRLPQKAKLVCIGEATAQRLRKEGRRADLTARIPTAAGLAEIILENEKQE